MTEHVFLLSEINPLEIYGVNDTRLAQIEQGFPEVKFVARGDELKVIGESERIEKLKTVLGALLAEIQSRGNITENRFSELLEPQGTEPAQPEIHPDEALVHGNSGIVVKAKNKGQRQIVASALENDVVFATGPAGTGKTYVAVALAVKALKEKRVKKIILCRPAVDAGESLASCQAI